MRPTAWTPALALMGAIAPADGHHSWSANYDASKTVSVVGVITQLRYRSPHSVILLEVPNQETGRNERWTLEWGSPRGLRERGVDNRTLKVGDRLSVSGTAHRKPSTRSIHLQSLTRLSDGLRISGRGRVEGN